MIEADEQERNNAIQNQCFHHDVPSITVVVDSGWSKRSHRHSYKAKSGVAVIIGYATQKILFLVVRNKYCTVCSIAKRKG